MQRIAIIGGGPAGLLAANQLCSDHEVHVFDHQRSIGRKFLVAGKGGFNLTNELDGEALIEKYTPKERMRPILKAFGSKALREWFASIGIQTYVGTSGRVFPMKGIKPVHVLAAIRNDLVHRGVIFHLQHQFTGFDHQAIPIIEHEGSRMEITATRYFFGLGGASWPSTGSDAKWLEAFRAIGIGSVPFKPSNCGVQIDMPEQLKAHAGRPIKNITISIAGRTIRGECLITDHGLEGNAIYPIIAGVRDLIEQGQSPMILIDLKPDLDHERIKFRIEHAGSKGLQAVLPDRPTVALFKAFTERGVMLDTEAIARYIKALPIPILALRPLPEAISSAGGIDWRSLNGDLSLTSYPHLVVMGEMLDWDAPTGGFLLQGVFSTAYWAASKFAEQAERSIGRNGGRSDECRV